jgi:hypothetical protein
MSRGYLIHAYNNSEIDYGTMAICSSLLIKKHLKEQSTAVATSQDTLFWMIKTHGEDLVNHVFDHIIITDIDRNVPNRSFHDTRYTKKTAPYYNTNRSDSFVLSPFDETLLIDADFLVLDNSLDAVWGSTEEILVNKSVCDLNHIEDLGGFDKRFNNMSIPLYWATVMYFKKTDKTKCLFDLIKFIKHNYRYYQSLYKVPPGDYFRNDYALSIAIHMMNAQFEGDTVKNLPNKQLMFATENDDIAAFDQGTVFFTSEARQGEFKLHKVNTNVHVMNKWSIGRVAERIINYATN